MAAGRRRSQRARRAEEQAVDGPGRRAAGVERRRQQRRSAQSEAAVGTARRAADPQQRLLAARPTTHAHRSTFTLSSRRRDQQAAAVLTAKGSIAAATYQTAVAQAKPPSLQFPTVIPLGHAPTQ